MFYQGSRERGAKETREWIDIYSIVKLIFHSLLHFFSAVTLYKKKEEEEEEEKSKGKQIPSSSISISYCLHLYKRRKIRDEAVWAARW